MRSPLLVLACLSPLLLVTVAMIHERPSNPAVHPERTLETALDVPPHIRAFLRKSCYDCHSSETRWPWYAGVPPVSGLIEADVRSGRAAMNFSEWSVTVGANPARAVSMLSAACAAVQLGLMPKRPYPYLHPDARPSRDETESFCQWTKEQASRLRTKSRDNQHTGGTIHN
jgi:hypothetical protein